MKLLVLVATVFLTNLSFSQTRHPEQLVKFKKNEHNFGKIKQGSVVSFDFLFDNISQENVTIESVIAPCGCMTTYKPESAIAKGKSEKITAEFTAGKMGPFNKIFIVKLVGIEKPLNVTITGDVLDHDNWLVYDKSKAD